MAKKPKPADRTAFWGVVRLLKLLASPRDQRGVRIRITDRIPKDCLGDCTQYEKHYLIRLNKEALENSPEIIYMLLAHEWAHALAWENCSHSHGDAWGIALAKSWRVISGEVSVGDVIDAELG